MDKLGSEEQSEASQLLHRLDLRLYRSVVNKFEGEWFDEWFGITCQVYRLSEIGVLSINTFLYLCIVFTLSTSFIVYG